jgi:hypothetical protein
MPLLPGGETPGRISPCEDDGTASDSGCRSPASRRCATASSLSLGLGGVAMDSYAIGKSDQSAELATLHRILRAGNRDANEVVIVRTSARTRMTVISRS